MAISDNLAAIRMELPDTVQLVAVSKFHPVTTLMDAYGAGQRVFGESRVQELVAKQLLMPADVEWHFIGTLQTNKVKYIAPFISMIHSVDSVRLLQEIDRRAAEAGRTIRALIETHVAEETTKHGFGIGECLDFFRDGGGSRFANVDICGLMGMATFTDDMEQVRREFRALKQLFEEIRALPETDKSVFRELSMGMSDDYHIAIEEGSTMVRIGTKIFGGRT